MTTTTYAQRYHQLTAQHAYEARIRAFGLSALLAPYTVKAAVRIPSQRVGGAS